MSSDPLGDVSYREGAYAAARRFLDASLRRARELGGRVWIASVLPTLAHVLVEQADDAQAGALLAESVVISRDLGDRQGISRGLEGFAHLAIAKDRPTHGLRLTGAAAALREAIGAPLSASQRASRERRLASARAALGEDASAVALAEGRAMTLEQALEVAWTIGDGQR